MNIRKSNFELLRIISMLFIVLYHVIVHGHVIENSKVSSFNILIEIILFTIIIHVNLFIILSGYFQINKKFNQKQIWKITNASLFYKITIMTLFAIFNIIKLDKVTILKEISPLNIDDYWFVKYYIILYCISPFLNKLALSLNKRQYKNMIICLTIIFSIIPYLTGTKAFENNGFTLYNFVYLYLIGGYLKLHSINIKSNKKKYRYSLLIIFVCCIISNYFLTLTFGNLKNIGPLSSEIFGNIYSVSKLYSNPFIILQTITFFLLFETFNFQNKFINYISKLTFGVYLIHDNIFMTNHLYKWLRIDIGPITSSLFIFKIIIASIIIFIICSFIEDIRQKIFKFIYDRKISTNIRKKYYKSIQKRMEIEVKQ